MGLFSRKDPASPEGQRGKPRPSVSSEAQAAELRARARRRLAGAVALVLAAVIVLPMVLDSEPVPVAEDIPIRIPDREQPFQPQISTPQLPVPGQPQGGDALAEAQPGSQAEGQQPPADAPPSQEAPAEPPQPQQPDDAPAAPPAAARDGSRTDDGARALALLEGREVPPARAPAQQPAKPPATKGGFVLQVAAYSGETDARARRDKLHAAGVTNAYIEPVDANGKRQYRLRVGPFPSRDAAQAAQARLRTLGYDNGFIAAQ